jgi:PPOX class probable F420-dependent enzyme
MRQAGAMTLDEAQCWSRLRATRHGVLATLHPDRGVDAVPVVFAVLDGRIVVPVDTVKTKVTTRLRRLANLDYDDRCVLLIEQYDDDWSRLWWVRVHARAVSAAEVPAPVLTVMAALFPTYRAPGSIVGAITLNPTEVTGWSAAES